MTNNRAHIPHVAATTATGIGVLSEAAMSRTFALRLFYRLGVSSNGRPGGRGRKARRCFSGTPPPVSVAHPIGVGLAVQNRNWSINMCQSTPTTPHYVYHLTEEQEFTLSRARHLAELLNLLADSKPREFIDLPREALCSTYGLLADMLAEVTPVFQPAQGD